MAGSVHFKFTINDATWRRMDRILAKAALEMRQKMVVKAIRKGARRIARAMKAKCPPPGYAGDKPGLKPLEDTIGVVVRDYGAKTHATIGPQYPAGAHAHNVEFGHKEILFGEDTGRRVPPHPFARPAFDESKGQAQNDIVRSLIDDVRKLGG